MISNNSNLQVDKQSLDVDLKEFSLKVKQDCPHFVSEHLKKFQKKLEEIRLKIFDISCKYCENLRENLICLECLEIFCSKKDKGHYIEHIKSQNQKKSHQVSISLIDGKIWCQDCNNYIQNEEINKFEEFYSNLVQEKENDKKKNQKEKENQDLQDIVLQLENLLKQNKQKDEGQKKNQLTKQNLIDNLKKGVYKKITFLVGAGISVSAGIPDFRSPGTGIYSQLQAQNLPRPESVFDIQYFRINPRPFYLVSKEINSDEAKPTISHYFMNEFQKRGQLELICTQNIDGLELDAGIKENHIIQAHGHYRSAHCINCKVENSIQEFIQGVQNGGIQRCKNCLSFVKPDIIFFGEDLPKSFNDSYPRTKQSDLIFIMGTSLKVFPFAELVTVIKKDTPIVLINRENSTLDKIDQDRVIFYEGDIDENVKQIYKELEWEIPDISVKKPKICFQKL